MHAKVDRFRELLAFAERNGAPRELLQGSARELGELIEQASLLPDPRKVRTLSRVHQVRRALDSGATRAEIMRRLGLTTSTYHRLAALSRDSRDMSAVKRSPAKQEATS